MTVPLVLASASPARLATLRAAGIEPTVIVSDVDEDAALADARAQFAEQFRLGLGPDLALRDTPHLLATLKLGAVRREHNPDALILACDSMLEFDGKLVGKPRDAAEAISRWTWMRGKIGLLHTGHVIQDNRVDRRPQSLHDTTRGDVATTVVHFADLSDAEIDAYVATGEPLHVAGAFTIDGLGGPFIERIEGDHHNVVGLSLPLLRRLLGELGLTIPQFWAAPPAPPAL